MTTEILELQAPRPAPAPARGKLPEGWHYTERYGEVFVSPGGIAWVVKEMPNGELRTVSVTLTPADIIKMPATERVKHASAERKRYHARLTARKPPNFGAGKAEDGKQGTLAGVK